MRAKAKKLTLAATIAASALLVACLGTSSIFAVASDGDSVESESTAFSRSAYSGTQYYSGFNSIEAAADYAKEINKELASEGIVLLKNDGSLPIDAGKKVSVLGIAQDCLNETTGSITGSLRNAGYVINPTLEELYTNDSASNSDYMNETKLNGTQIESMKDYNDVAVVVLARGTGGESGDRSMNTGEVEEETYLGEDTGWAHAAHASTTAGEGDGAVTTSYKHELQLSASEEELISLAETYCKKVVVLYSSGNQLEMANLENDDNINAIAWIGRLGNGGIDAVGEILNGTINPSGKTVDEWTRDFTNDPTYANALATNYKSADEESDDEGEVDQSNSGTIAGSGFSGYDYEEDIYLGYKFYETYWKEASEGNALTDGSADSWYADNVVYPFGYGLSYTSFSYSLKSVKTNGSTALEESYEASAFNTSSASDLKTAITSMTAEVEVTNTGDVAGKEVVQIYVEAPYNSSTAPTEKPYLVMVGFGKTDTLKPGQSQTLDITFNVQDFASYDSAANGGTGAYVLDAGQYTIHVMESSAHTNIATTNTEDAYESASFELEAQAALCVDDYSGNTISNKFSDSESDYYSMLVGVDAGSFEEKTIGDEVTSRTLSRADFDATMPTAPLASQLAVSDDTVALMSKYENTYADGGDFEEWYEGADEDGSVTIPDGWTQAAGEIQEDGMYKITLADMAGVSIDESKWTDFMNQLTWSEIASLLNAGGHVTGAISTIGKLETADENGPNYAVDSNEYTFVGEPNVAATWNTELVAQYGRIFANLLLWQGVQGHYGPGMNIHRSAFSGRSPEYYSQDGILSGFIGAAFVNAETQCGINVYIKHFAVYETAGIGTGCANVSEQAMRENYLKPFEMSMQGEYGAHASMTSWNRIGAVWAGQNYALTQGIARDEWGWNGFFVTDNTWQASGSAVDALIRTGSNLPDGTLTGTAALSGTWMTIADDGVEADGVYIVSSDADSGYVLSNVQWYCARTAAMQVLYNEANSAGAFNGVTDNELEVEVDLVQGVAVTDAQSSILPDKYTTGQYIVLSSVTAGELPTGLSIVDGMLTGVPTAAGEFEVTLKIMIDGWIPIELNLTINVESLITTELATSLEIGDSVDALVNFDAAGHNSTDLADKYSSVSWEITDGVLPEGIALEESNTNSTYISGTATKAGTYSFNITVNALTSVVVLDMSNAMVQMMIANGAPTDIDGFVASFNSYGSLLYMFFNASDIHIDDDGNPYIEADALVNIGWASYVSTPYTLAYTITVTGGDAADEEPEASKTIASITSDGNGTITITYSDNTTDTITVSTSGSSSGSTASNITISTDSDGNVVISDGTSSYTVPSAASAGSSSGSASDSGSSSSTESSSSSGNGLAVAGLVIACVAVVAAVAGIVLVLLRKKNG